MGLFGETSNKNNAPEKQGSSQFGKSAPLPEKKAPQPAQKAPAPSKPKGGFATRDSFIKETTKELLPSEKKIFNETFSPEKFGHSYIDTGKIASELGRLEKQKYYATGKEREEINKRINIVKKGLKGRY